MRKRDHMNKPNLFSYATSELSQDAFICWLLSWASPEYKNSDNDLHECAAGLITLLFDKHKLKLPEIEQVEIRKQDKNIDVLCIINSKYPIIIEDKTVTKHHSNQLARYIEEIKGRDFDDDKIIPVYYKTEDQGNYSSVKKNGYHLLLREEIVDVLNKYRGTNSIFLDYRDHLQSITDKVERYKSISISDWGWYSWVGFFRELQKQLKGGNWDYVANPSGGFLGFWWQFQENEECAQYLQLEKDKFCFKIRVKNEAQQKSLRKKWHKIFKEKAQDFELRLVKPKRFRNGKHMTVCVYDGDYRKTIDGILDMSATIAQFRKAENLLKSVHEIA